MKKIAMLMAPLLLFTPFIFEDFTSEVEETVVKEMVDVPLYVVYKVEISAINFTPPSDSAQVVFFEDDDTDGKAGFEYALKEGKPLSEGLDVHWDNINVHNVTAYIFGYPPEVNYGYSDTYYQTYNHGDDWTRYHYLTHDDILDLSSSTDVFAGQKVKITVQDMPYGAVPVFKSSYTEYDDFDDEILIEKRGDFVMCNDAGWAGPMPYVTYTIEYKELSPKVNEYGQIFLVLGVLPILAMIWFGRSQKIKD